MATGSLSSQIRRFNRLAIAATEKTTKAITAELLGHVILGSPVDSGRFAGNWRTGKGSPVTTVINRIDAGKQTVMGEMLSVVAGAPAEGTIYLTNNLPYAMALEFGYSGQAPSGMVRLSVAKLPAIIREAIRENRM